MLRRVRVSVGIFLLVLYPTLLQAVTIKGFFGSTGKTLCLHPISSTVNFSLSSEHRNCIFFADYTGVIGGGCDDNMTLEADNLIEDTRYYKVTIRSEDSFDEYFELEATGDEFELGECPEDSLARLANMDPKDLSFTISLVGFFAVAAFVTITLVGIKNV